MTYQEAVNLISSVLGQQRLTIQEHTRLQEAWRMVLERSKEDSDGNDAAPVLDPLQSG